MQISKSPIISGYEAQPGTSLKIEELRSNKITGKLSYDQQPEFRSLSEFYIIIFLNKLKIVENAGTKIKIKRLWLRRPSEIHRHFLASPGSGPMYRLNPLS